MRIVVYYRGILINDRATIAMLRYYYENTVELDCDFDDVIVSLIFDHEYHLETWDGKRLFDVFIVSG